MRVAVFRWLLDGGDEEEEEFEQAGREGIEAEGSPFPTSVPQPAFLSLFRRTDPSPAVFAALSGRPDLLLPYSEAREREGEYFDRDGVRGTVLIVNYIEWIDERTAETTAGMHAGPLAAYSNRLRVSEVDGEWVVEDLGLEWIS
ncbi:MAG: hypothetical protein H6831_04190 [Planctomycetes bacterium]|nr:hypothetical protein [Planctomycetota bacterium]MCB9903587.1 hypothetical protein [Planctomycetota bacterium]